MLSLVVLLIVVYLAVHRDTFVPFIGETVFPFTLIKDTTFIKTHGTVSKTVHIDAPDGTKVAYRASMPNTHEEPDPQVAYNKYQNSGVTTVKKNQAILTVSCPAAY